MEWFIKVILGSDLPFLILFVGLAYVFMKQSWEREQAQRTMIYNQLETVNKEIKLLVEVWQVIIEGELERRNKK